jgi:hypothetical protein
MCLIQRTTLQRRGSGEGTLNEEINGKQVPNSL